MRDERRIERIMTLIGHLWMKNPDYRFGQLLINYGLVDDSVRVWKNEDDGLEEYLKDLLEEKKR